VVDELFILRDLIRNWNQAAAQISKAIGRPAIPGHIAEFIASRIFDIRLFDSASHKAVDGHFNSGPLAGKSVNIKWSAKHERLLNLGKEEHPDYYLVLTGPEAPPTSSRGQMRLWAIDYVFLFNSSILVERLRDRGVNVGTASSVRKSDWMDAEIFPASRNPEYQLTEEQKECLSLFSSEAVSA